VPATAIEPMQVATGGFVGHSGASGCGSAGLPPPLHESAPVCSVTPAPRPVPPAAEFCWMERQASLLTADFYGAPIHPHTLPAPGTNPLQVDAELSPALLYWADRRQWMWHKKWALPSLTVRVSRRPQLAGSSRGMNGVHELESMNGMDPAQYTPSAIGHNERLYAIVTAGTVKDEAPDTLLDVGLDGECQRVVELGASGHAEVRFSRLLFQRTSFNCGNRSFRLVVTIAKAATGAAGSSGDAAVDAPSGSTPSETAERAPLIPLVCLCSTAVHVDARKRSKNERPEAKDDDVRLVQRMRPAPAPSASASASASTYPTQAQQPPPQAGLAQVGGWLANLAGNIAGGGRQQQSGAPPEGLLDAAGDALLQLRPDGVVLVMHSSTAFGYTPEQLLGRSFLTICHPDDRAGLLRTVQSLVLTASGRHASGVVTPAHPSSLRVLHRIVLGLTGGRPPEPIAVDSILSVSNAHGRADAPQTIYICSRSALPLASVTDASGGFCFRVVPHPIW
jgi:hypothetical protein